MIGCPDTSITACSAGGEWAPLCVASVPCQRAAGDQISSQLLLPAVPLLLHASTLSSCLPCAGTIGSLLFVAGEGFATGLERR